MRVGAARAVAVMVVPVAMAAAGGHRVACVSS